MGKHLSRISFPVVTVAALGAAQTSVLAADEVLPRMAVPMGATSYPLEALAANQEGTAVIELTIGPDGAVTHVEMREPTGYPLLDDAALITVRAARLSDPPTTLEGVPTTARVLADVTWTLPLESAEMYMLPDLPGGTDIYPGDTVVEPSHGDHGNSIGINDYPYGALRRGETGKTVLRILVGRDGLVSDVRIEGSSGYPNIDEASANAVRRFRYDAGTVNGQPSSMWVSQVISFQIFDAPILGCQGVPSISQQHRRQPTAALEESAKYERYTKVNQEGVIEESLLLTDQGWMRLNDELLAEMNARANYGRISFHSEHNGIPQCWFYDGVNPMLTGEPSSRAINDSPNHESPWGDLPPVPPSWQR